MAQPYQLSEVKASVKSAELSGLIWLGAARAQELLALGLREEAKEQWQHTLNQADLSGQMALGMIALQRGWPDFGVDAAITGGNWDRLDLRFPYAFWEEFQTAAKDTDQDPFVLIALARRESGLNPLARSKVGARGLMQLMPATARSVAKENGVSYRGVRTLYDPQVNIAWGTSYYAGLVERYDGNRVKALAAYNAGPSRVSRWLSDSLSVDQWVDSLPFAETREYVQAVLTYRVIYRLRAGEPAMLLTQGERDELY
jgi:soluble lytic murein transglycosylase